MTTVKPDAGGIQPNNPSRRGFMLGAAGTVAGAAVPIAAAAAPAPSRSGPPGLPGLNVCPICGECELDWVGSGEFSCPDCRAAPRAAASDLMTDQARRYGATQLHAAVKLLVGRSAIVDFGSAIARVSLTSPDARTFSMSTSTCGKAVRSFASPIAFVKRSIVAEIPHTMGMGGFEPAWPWIRRATMVLRSAARFMPR